MHIEVIRALGPSPAEIETAIVELPEGASVIDAVRVSGLDFPDLAGYAVYGERVTPAHPLHNGDRLELLRALRMDPKQAEIRPNAAPALFPAANCRTGACVGTVPDPLPGTPRLPSA